MSEVTIWAAFGAGIASFISPCCLPLYPSYLSYITGVSVTDLKSEHPGKQVRMRTMSHTLFFILGFSVVYYTLGYSTNKFAEFFSEYQTLIRQLSAVLIILMGLILVGLIQPGYAHERAQAANQTEKVRLSGLLYIRNRVLCRLVTMHRSDIGKHLAAGRIGARNLV